MTIIVPASPYYSPFVGGAPSTPAVGNKNANAVSNISILATAFLAIMATGGPTYSFGVYAATLKEDLGLSQSQLETLGAASFAAGLLSWIPGLLVDFWGSRKALVVGGLGQSIGFTLYWWVAKFGYEQFEIPSAWIIPILCFLSTFIFAFNNLVIGGVFKAIVISCGLGTKGKAVGGAKAYLGLGAGVFSSLFRAFHSGGSDLDFLAMSSLLAIIAIAVPAILGLPTREALEKYGTRDDSTSRHYNVVYAGLFLLALMVVGSSVMFLIRGENEVDDENASDDEDQGLIPEWLHGILILLLWVGPILGLLLVPGPNKSKNKKDFRKSLSSIRRSVRQAMNRDGNSTEQIHLLAPMGAKSNGVSVKQVTFPQAEEAPPSKASESSQAKEEPETLHETPQPVPDLTLMEMLRTIRAWLFLIAATILVGSGTMLTINMGQLVQSRGLQPETASACLAIFSVAQAAARVTSGAMSEAALQWKVPLPFLNSRQNGIPRPFFLILSCAFAVVGHICLATQTDGLHLFVSGIIFTGFSFGAMWPLMVLIIGDLFGTVNHGANYLFADGITCAAGTLSIAKYLTQFVYEQNVLEGDGEASNVCFGADCFRLTHQIIACLCMVALCASVALMYMARNSYGG